eukprot:TRINITY_DN8809_c0_g2_i2.p1 TRINITY_DN8809_c0_g2~~TRINITY_DN8809_c0_g2_i2.p1  ORF type:complete len:363 (+),score=70.46 TRINITY_DN8809_c0_g2_i2:28-1089(+)
MEANSSSFTCNTCRMVYPDGESQRDHYRSAWHCFNLKRKVAGLGPVVESVFNEKVGQLKEAQNPRPVKHTAPTHTKSAPTSASNDGPKTNNTTTTPTTSVQPTNELPTIEEKNETSEHQPTEEELIQERLRTAKAIPTHVSFFDNHVSADVESNLEYMRKHYGLFIPEIDYLVELDGFMEYLGQKVGIGYACLWCQKEFRSMTAAQRHMVDKSHCKISFYDHEEEFEDFYDFSKGEDEENGKGKELVTVEDDDAPLVHLTSTGGELVLPSGTAIGHRSLRIYYKQRLRGEDTRLCVLANKLAHQYRDLGYETHLASRLHHETKAHHRAMDSSMRLGIKANKLPKYMRHNTSMC